MPPTLTGLEKLHHAHPDHPLPGPAWRLPLALAPRCSAPYQCSGQHSRHTPTGLWHPPRRSIGGGSRWQRTRSTAAVAMGWGSKEAAEHGGPSREGCQGAPQGQSGQGGAVPTELPGLAPPGCQESLPPKSWLRQMNLGRTQDPGLPPPSCKPFRHLAKPLLRHLPPLRRLGNCCCRGLPLLFGLLPASPVKAPAGIAAAVRFIEAFQVLLLLLLPSRSSVGEGRKGQETPSPLASVRS